MNQTVFAKIPFLLQRAALVLFSFLPIGLSLLVQVEYIRNDWTASQLLRIALFTGLLFLSLLAILFMDDLWTFLERRPYIPVLWVVLLAIALRLIVLPLLSTNFTSDFEDIHNFASDAAAGHPFARLSSFPSIPWATHLNVTGLFMSVLYRIFGASPSTAKMFMLVLSALTVWLIYLTGKELAGPRIGFLAASLYGTLPSLVCYTGVLTGEHFSLPLIVVAILLYTRLKQNPGAPLWRYIVGYGLCGAAIGFMDWFRPGGVILVIALIVADLIYMHRENIIRNQAIALAVMILSYIMVGNLAVTISESFFQTDVMSTFQKRGYFVLIGLNPDTEGRINLEDRGISFDAYDRFEDDNGAANQYLIQMAIDRLQGHSLWKLFRSKFTLLWANHEQLFQISLNGSDDVQVVEMLSNIESVLTLLIALFIGVNIYSSFVARSHPAVFAMQLFILGFAIWGLILEAQNRYTLITFPFMIVLASLGIREFMNFVKRKQVVQPA